MIKNLKYLLAIFVFLFLLKKGNSQVLYEIEDVLLIDQIKTGELKFSVAGIRNILFEKGKNKILKKGNTSFQIGYSPVKNFSVVASFYQSLNFRINENVLIREEIDFKKSNSGSIGIGYYKIFTKEERKSAQWIQPTKYTSIDAFLGYGIGNIQIDYFLNSQGDFSFRRYFFQIGYHIIKPKLKFDFVFNLSASHFKEINLYLKIPKDDLMVFRNLSEFPRVSSSSISTRVSILFKHFDFFITFNSRMKTGDRRVFFTENSNFNLGFLFKINLKKK